MAGLAPVMVTAMGPKPVKMPESWRRMVTGVLMGRGPEAGGVMRKVYWPLAACGLTARPTANTHHRGPGDEGGGGSGGEAVVDGELEGVVAGGGEDGGGGG